MKYQTLPIGLTIRRFRALAGKLRKMMADRSFWALLPEERQRLLSRLKAMYRQLSRVVAARELKKVIASGALLLSLGLGDVGAQTFGDPQLNPFGLQIPADGYYFPQFVDLDNDGDFDLMATGYFYPNDATIYYFENTGSPQAPNFAAPISDPFGVSLSETYITSLALGDLDNDGDFDMLIGKYEGAAFFYFENTGTPESPAFAGPVQNPFNLQPTGDFSIPLLLDMDDDGDLDLLSAGYSYDTEMPFYEYQENIGTPGAPDFAAPQVNPFGLSTNRPYAVFPSAVDMDEDGDLDLMVGGSDYLSMLPDTYRAYVSFVENTGTPQAPAFAGEVNEPFDLLFPNLTYGSFITMADLDADGDADLLSFTYQYDAVAGDGKNQFYYFENNSVVNVTTEALPDAAFRLFPTVTQTTVYWQLETPSIVTALHLTAHNANGQLVGQWTTADLNGTLEAGNLARGRYYVQLRDRKGSLLAAGTFFKQ